MMLFDGLASLGKHVRFTHPVLRGRPIRHAPSVCPLHQLLSVLFGRRHPSPVVVNLGEPAAIDGVGAFQGGPVRDTAA
uniref:Gp42 n=1 Tax=uncultured marine virus TaxID=186617 RepID=A0A0F7L580_9VIRU|nr:gp42 [uncultured marine virus]